MRIGLALAGLATCVFATAAVAASSEKLPSGVVITHEVVGQGAKPSATSPVEVHYEGTLPNGQVFDSSYRRGQTVTFNLDGVIPCWTQGVQRMAEGGTAILNCPAATAYGARGAGRLIPPNTDLTFKVQLLRVVK